MIEPKHAGRFRLFQENGAIRFFLVWFSRSQGEWSICDMRYAQDEEGNRKFIQYPDKTTKRKLTDAMWARLVRWC